MTGIQLGAGAIANSNWDTNYISAEEISHVDNVRLTEKIWDWLCDAFCGTHRAEAKEYIRQLDALSDENTPDMVGLKKDIFSKLINLTSNDYTKVDRTKGYIEYQIGYFKGKPKNHEIIKAWTRPYFNEHQNTAQVLQSKYLKDRLIQSFQQNINQNTQAKAGTNSSVDEPTMVARDALKSVPVYMAHRYAVSKFSPPLHAYIMAGEPGSKNARIYGEKNDMTRSQVNIDDAFIVALSQAKYVSRNSDGGKVKLPFEPALINAVERLKEQGKNFAFLDSFVDAVKSELKLGGAKMTLTESHRIGLGYIAAQQNGQQGFYNMDPRKGFTHNEDMSYFEQQKGPVKQQPIKLTTLQDISREQRVYQDYLNEKLGLNGLEQTKASIRTIKGDGILPESERKALKARSMVAYTPLPSDSPFESNCNRTAATYIQAAMNREQGLPIDTYQKVESGTKWALGIDTRSHIHNPIQKQSIEDIALKNGQDTAYERIRSLAGVLSNVKAFFMSKS
ncbi:hypothetical protein [Shewanella surugensis]|uniref:Uncharacterized protein n=1 Tax=Shewanella surugensis TaxID=212020 RepID=A0ABT0LAB8_9GAMM|nr:hypothetical protein [Shewanella surugensis]MCL1124619.1 hypothetical protein [Shewanella surugensis]